VQQARSYAEMLRLNFAYATNGHDIIEIDYFTGPALRPHRTAMTAGASKAAQTINQHFARDRNHDQL